METYETLTFDRFFKSDDPVVVNIICAIIEDRKFDIPKRFYPYITTNVIMTLLNNNPDNEKLIKLLIDIMKHGFNDSYYLGMCFIEQKLTKYLFLLNPKTVFTLCKKFGFCKNFMICESVHRYDIIEVIYQYMKYIGNDIPLEYFKCLSILYQYSVFELERDISVGYILMIHVMNDLKLMDDESYYLSHFNHVLDRFYEAFIMNKKLKPDRLNWRPDLLHKCWSEGIDFIPNDITENELILYFKTHFSNFKNNEFPDKLIPIVRDMVDNNSSDKLVDEIKSHILRSINSNFNNIKLICWSLDSSTLSCIRYLYKNTLMELRDYSYYHNIMVDNMNCSPYITFDEYAFFIKNKSGKKINDTIVSIYDYDQYVTFILTVLSDDDIRNKFMNDDTIPDYHHIDSDPSILKYIIDHYIIPNQNSRLIDRVLQLILPCNDIIDIIIDNEYISTTDLFNRTNMGLYELLDCYPNLAKYVTDIPRLVIVNILEHNPEAIYHFPITLVPTQNIIDTIYKTGYFNIVENFEDVDSEIAVQPARYIPTDELLSVIDNTGNGIGYCIDYRMEEYDKVLLEEIYNIYSDKNSI